LYLIPRYFATQSLIVFEWLARYPGPWERFWHISDGGYFENLAAYELVRRRVPRIIVNDGGADPSYEFEDFAEFVRKVRIDFNARVESWTEEEIDALVTNQLISAATRKMLGSVKELQTLSASGTGPKQTVKHACLCWVHYPSVPQSTRSLLLYVKASVNGDESADIAQYLRSHQEFPHESTGDQFFDEAQWESYRKLGEHIGKGLMETDWFWRIRLPSSEPGAA
jgi:hypothetical protein